MALQIEVNVAPRLSSVVLSQWEKNISWLKGNVSDTLGILVEISYNLVVTVNKRPLMTDDSTNGSIR